MFLKAGHPNDAASKRGGTIRRSRRRRRLDCEWVSPCSPSPVHTMSATSIAQELAEPPKSVHTMSGHLRRRLCTTSAVKTGYCRRAHARAAAVALPLRSLPEHCPRDAEPVDVCARDGGHRRRMIHGVAITVMWRCVYSLSGRGQSASRICSFISFPGGKGLGESRSPGGPFSIARMARPPLV